MFEFAHCQFQGKKKLITLDLSNVTLSIVFILVLYYHLNYTLNCMLQKTWPRDHESVVDLSQNLFIGSSTKHEKIKNFNVCLIFSPHYFIYMKFQLLIYGKLRTFEELNFRILWSWGLACFYLWCTNTIKLSCCKFCIYTHPVNSKCTTWHGHQWMDRLICT